MTIEQKTLAFQLLSGEFYLVKKSRHTGTDAYMLYKGNQVPIKYYSSNTVMKFKELLKADKKQRLTINLNLVRQLDGRSYLKKKYKRLQTKINQP